MIKRDITETIYEYDKEGKLVKKTVTETHEEEDRNTTPVPQTYPFLTNPCFPNTPYCETGSTSDLLTTHTMAMNETK